MEGPTGIGAMRAGLGARLDAAARKCGARGARLTDNRRDVLALILEAGGPLTAYALLDRLKERHRAAVPPTVYRALDFLIAQGLVHKIERLNAYVACVEDAEQPHRQAVEFLICRSCGHVAEIEADAVAAALARAAATAGFTPAQATIEVEGTCGACSARARN